MKHMRWATAAVVALLACSCSTTKSAKAPLRVGVTPNYPPLIMMQGEKAAGIECDFAAQLSSELGRPLELLKVPWDELFDELEGGHIDIIIGLRSCLGANSSRISMTIPGASPQRIPPA